MKTWQRCLVVGTIGALSAVTCGRAYGDDGETSKSASPYQANEVSLDLFASGTVGRETIEHISGDRVKEDGELGAGLGLSYFATRHIGLMADAYTEDTDYHFVDATSANLVLRLPLGESCVAPYVFGGGGYQWDTVKQWSLDAGAGVEFRFTHNVGFFVDARYVFPDKTSEYGVGRAGLRVTF